MSESMIFIRLVASHIRCYFNF